MFSLTRLSEKFSRLHVSCPVVKFVFKNFLLVNVSIFTGCRTCTRVYLVTFCVIITRCYVRNSSRNVQYVNSLHTASSEESVDWDQLMGLGGSWFVDT